uniref:zinc-binding dehydrogenase n=1 Tax=Lentzea alba TaxID=2714351 RepID=UPI0039BFA07B
MPRRLHRRGAGPARDDRVEQGGLRVRIDSVYPLTDTAQAHRRGETDRAGGKVVLRVAEACGDLPPPAPGPSSLRGSPLPSGNSGPAGGPWTCGPLVRLVES